MHVGYGKEKNRWGAEYSSLGGQETVSPGRLGLGARRVMGVEAGGWTWGKDPFPV